MAGLTGWGRTGWSSGAWSEAGNIQLPSFATTFSVGSLTVDAEANFTPASVAITSAVGSLTTRHSKNVVPASVAITSAIGTPIPASNNNLSVSTVGSITSALNTSLVIKFPVTVRPSGFAITSGLGSTTIFENEVINLPSQAITSAVGAPTASIPKSVTLTGRAITSAIGSVTVHESIVQSLPTLAITSGFNAGTARANADVLITDSFVVTNSVGSVLVWGQIDESQTPSYTTIDESQNATWQEVA